MLCKQTNVDISGKEPACQCKDLRDLSSFRVGKIPWRRAWQPTPIFLPGESLPVDRGAWRGLVHRVAESGMTEATSRMYKQTKKPIEKN